jgi:hypothetical protein
MSYIPREKWHQLYEWCQEYSWGGGGGEAQHRHLWAYCVEMWDPRRPKIL